MLFTSPVFLFLFFPGFFLLYFLRGRFLRNGVTLFGSFLFYFWGEPKFSLVVVGTIISDWVLANYMSASNLSACRKKTVFILSLLINISLLLYFKYTNFILENFNVLISSIGDWRISWPQVALPIGVSFIVFEKITYVADIYKGKCEPARSLFSYATYILLFPKLLAGPIVKYHDIEADLQRRKGNLDEMVAGISRFVFGLAKKVLIADTLSLVADEVFATPVGSLCAYDAWMGAFFFTFQIFFDFSAYSDMAIGMAKMLGFALRENFNQPYLAINFTDFWKRWHISLSSWIREYLYIPLGGNRVSRVRGYVNIWICFLISGIWHGASWTFVVWGIYHGFFLFCDRLFWVRVSARLPRVVNIALTNILVIVGWVLFRAPNLHYAMEFIEKLFIDPFVGSGGLHEVLYIQNSSYMALWTAILLTFVPLFGPQLRQKVLGGDVSRLRTSLSNPFLVACCILLALLSLARVSVSNFKPFLYFRF